MLSLLLTMRYLPTGLHPPLTQLALALPIPYSDVPCGPLNVDTVQHREWYYRSGQLYLGNVEVRPTTTPSRHLGGLGTGTLGGSPLVVAT